MSDRYLKTDELNNGTREAAWAAFRRKEFTWIDDEHGHIATIGPASHTCRVLTINDSILLGDLHRGVERGLKLRYYQFGTRDVDHPLVVTMRAFTYDGGNLYPHDADIRDAYVWCSGFMERWFKVDELIKALGNIDGKHGLEEPMAVIDSE